MTTFVAVLVTIVGICLCMLTYLNYRIAENANKHGYLYSYKDKTPPITLPDSS